MIIKFQVSNFRSICKMQELALFPSRVRKFPEHVYKTEAHNFPDILKSAVIYGANAAGKSNLIKAMAFSRDVIVSSRKTNLNVPFFKLTEHPQNETKFLYEIFIDEICYRYWFIFNNDVIKEERLERINKKKKHGILYTRKTDGEKVNVSFSEIFKDNDSKGFHNTICKGTKPNQLFLNFINEQNAGEIEESFKQVYLWFRNKLTIIFPTTKYWGSSIHPDKNRSLWDFYNLHLNEFDTGIDKLAFDEFEIDDQRFDVPSFIKNDIKQKNQNESEVYTISNRANDIYHVGKIKGELKVKKLQAAHRIPFSDNDPTNFNFSDESDGTNRLMDIFPLLYSLKQGGTVVIDEIDRSLHSLLVKKYFDCFFNETRGISAQLIATTHNLMLLDNDIFRRDEIWFVEKDEKEQSCLYSLEEFKPRFDKQLIKAYLGGRFGAIPLPNPG